MKKISIITINYNNREGLKKTIESVINQTYTDYEYIIIDGGSTDGSVEVIKESLSKIDYWVSEPDKGAYNAMNKGIIQANGNYLIFMNSGDCFHNNMVLSQVIQQENDSDIIVGRICGVKSELLSPKIPRINMYLFYTSTLPHQGTFIKRKLFNDALYDESLKIVSDWKFFLETIIFKGCSTLLIDTAIARCDNQGISSNVESLRKEKERVLQELIPKGILSDYSQLNKLGIKTIENMIYLNNHDRLRRYVYYITTLIIRINCFFEKR